MNNVNRMTTVKFEPAGWRTTGDASAPKSVKLAFNDAIVGMLKFFDEHRVRAGKVYGKDCACHVYAELPESLVGELEKQPFVGRDYPDQVKSTLQVLSR